MTLPIESDPAIAALVDRGRALHGQIDSLKGELKEIEEALCAAALRRSDEHEPLADAEREGRQWIAHGTSHAVPVIMTADKLVQSFAADSPKHQELNLLLGDARLRFFFTPKTTWGTMQDDGKKFRRLLSERLPADLAAKTLTACLARDKHGIPKSDVYPDWDRAATTQPAAAAS